MNALVHINPATSPVSELEILENKITQLAANINAANYQFVVLLAEFDERKGWASWGCKSCAHWLNWKCGIALGAAREKVRVGNALAALPKVKAAFASGLLSYSKARAITRVASVENEDDLLAIAEHGTASHIEKTVRHFRQVTKEQAQDQHDKRCLKYRWDDDGNLVVNATLSAEQGALFLKALEINTEALEQDERANDLDDEKGKSVPAETCIAPQLNKQLNRRMNRRADALVLMAETQLAHAGTTTKTADHYQVLIHADEQCGVHNGPALAEETVKRVCCDASVSRITSTNGEPVSIGRKSRTVPPPMRRALQLRDGGCKFPGCCSSRYVDAHHIQHWAEGGETSLHNLVLLCRHHHRLVHEGGYSVVRAIDGVLSFHQPGGEFIPGLPSPAIPVPLPTSSVSKWLWNGDSMDYGLVVESMVLKRSERERALGVSAGTCSEEFTSHYSEAVHCTT